eukprot:1158758-Pelagomonas_calceolata.AAC.10
MESGLAIDGRLIDITIEKDVHHHHPLTLVPPIMLGSNVPMESELASSPSKLGSTGPMKSGQANDGRHNSSLALPDSPVSGSQVLHEHPPALQGIEEGVIFRVCFMDAMSIHRRCRALRRG